MMKAPLFSIVIPTYNRSELVQGAVRSVLGQSFDDFEIVVSDNCSHDDTREVVERFQDPRVRYVRTPTHGVIADSWEFARSQARGELVMMLSDDDALVHNALARFAEEHRRHGAEFLFCNLAEYRDRSFLGSHQNTVNCRPFSGTTRVVSTEEFLGPLFAFHPKFDMHPSAFMFASTVAEEVVRRCGRFFQTNGVEYFAWPLAAVFARNIVYIDAPLVILGRTAKSWGSTVVLSNPGKQQIQKMISDVAQNRDWIPLTNFTLSNLMAEGMLLGKQLFPDELRPFPFDEQLYLRSTMSELKSREAMGVDVGPEIQELLEYADRYPSLKAEFLAPPRDGLMGHDSAIRDIARTLGLNLVYRRLAGWNEVRKIKGGQVKSGFMASGGDFGFADALECAAFLSRVTSSAPDAPPLTRSVRIGAEDRRLAAKPAELWQYRELFYFFVWRDVKVRYAQSILGIGWAIIQPLVPMVLFTIVFGRVARISSDGIPYAMFSYTALVPWIYFSNALADSSGSLVKEVNMLSKIYFPRLIIPLTSVLGRLIDLVISFLLLFVLMAWYRATPTLWVVLLPLLILMAIFTASGLGMWLSALAVQYRDVKYAVPFAIQFLMYAAPVVYPTSLIPHAFRYLYALNPLVGVIEGFRACLLGSTPVPWDLIAIGSVSSLMMLWSGTVYFIRKEPVFADVA